MLRVYSWNCFNATMNRPVVNGTSSKLIYWFNRWGTQQMSYWGNATTSSEWGNRMVCECGLNRSCVDTALPCNCDKADGIWHRDSGFLSNSNDLPVTSLVIGSSGKHSALVTFGLYA